MYRLQSPSQQADSPLCTRGPLAKLFYHLSFVPRPARRRRVLASPHGGGVTSPQTGDGEGIPRWYHSLKVSPLSRLRRQLPPRGALDGRLRAAGNKKNRSAAAGKVTSYKQKRSRTIFHWFGTFLFTHTNRSYSRRMTSRDSTTTNMGRMILAPFLRARPEPI